MEYVRLCTRFGHVTHRLENLQVEAAGLRTKLDQVRGQLDGLGSVPPNAEANSGEPAT